MDSEGYQYEIDTWREGMDARLRADESWLTLAGLHWLEEGVNRVGSQPGLEVQLPPNASPASVGVFELHDGKVTFRGETQAGATADGQLVTSVVMQADTTGAPTRLRAGTVTMVIIERGGRRGVRVWNREHPARKRFAGRQWFRVDPRFRIEARFVPYDPPRPIRIASVLGDVEEALSPGEVAFELGGVGGLLVASEVDNEGLFFNFTDPTNGSSTYPGGRFLWTSPPESGKVIVDFNRAYNPPCAFTPYATCPIPIDENHLRQPIEAGERFVEHEATT
jgi:uncharacterized protein (DUF1684 family)